MNPKDLRKQLKNVVQDMLPEALSAEISEKRHKELQVMISARLEGLERLVREKLEAIDSRAKDLHSLMTRAALAGAPVPTSMEQPSVISEDNK